MFTAQPTLLIGESDWDPDMMPKEEFERRIAALWRACPAASCAVVYGDRLHHAELAYLTNLVPKLEAAVAVLSPNGEHAIYVGGGPNMIGAALPLTWIKDLIALRDGQSIGRRAMQSQGGGPVLIGGSYMRTALRQGIIEGMGASEPVRDETAQVWKLMRHTTIYELLAVREASLALSDAISGIADALTAGAGVTDAILAGERVANARGAQDVRTLFNAKGGRILQPFTAAVDARVNPLQVYVAVRRFNYWAEGFYSMSDKPQPAFDKACEVLRLVLAAIRTGTRTADVANLIAAAVRPYRTHPVTERSFANLIGVGLEEPPYSIPGPTFEALEFYTVKVGVTDDANSHAIVSAMIRVRDDGIDTFWSGCE